MQINFHPAASRAQANNLQPRVLSPLTGARAYALGEES
jgi:hypothetical protein